MRKIFITIVILGAYLEGFHALQSGQVQGRGIAFATALPSTNEFVLDEINRTSITVNREGASDSQNDQDYQSHFHYQHNVNIPDNGRVSYDPNPTGQYQGYPNRIQNSPAHQSSYEDLHYDHEPKVHLLLSPGKEKQKHSVCPQFSQFSIVGVVLAMLLIFNGLISALSMYNLVDNGGTGTITNMFTSTDTNNNQDINNNDNAENNVNVNIIGRASQGKEYGSSIWEEESNGTEEDDCPCPQEEEDSWLVRIKDSLLAVWTVGQGFNSENPDCASRLACEVVSFLPSSLPPLLAVLPSGMRETRSLLKSAISGNCALAYDKCQFPLGPAIIQVTQWLYDLW